MADRAAQRSREIFESGFHCAESVLMAVAESKGIRSPIIPKIATGFCGGVSRTCGMCGAVSGAVMAIGLLSGRSSPKDSVEDSYSKVRKVVAMFEAKFGTTNCKELIGCDLGTEDGQNYFKINRIRERCAAITEEATRMAVSVIDR